MPAELLDPFNENRNMVQSKLAEKSAQHQKSTRAGSRGAISRGAISVS